MMLSPTLEAPKFHKGQRVRFVGGEGVVRSCHLASGSWTYQVEMCMGPEPEFGRVGYETTVLMNEVDIRS